MEKSVLRSYVVLLQPLLTMYLRLHIVFLVFLSITDSLFLYTLVVLGLPVRFLQYRYVGLSFANNSGA